MYNQNFQNAKTKHFNIARKKGGKAIRWDLKTVEMCEKVLRQRGQKGDEKQLISCFSFWVLSYWKKDDDDEEEDDNSYNLNCIHRNIFYQLLSLINIFLPLFLS